MYPLSIGKKKKKKKARSDLQARIATSPGWSGKGIGTVARVRRNAQAEGVASAAFWPWFSTTFFGGGAMLQHLLPSLSCEFVRRASLPPSIAPGSSTLTLR